MSYISFLLSPECEHHRTGDVIFVLDGSRSIWPPHFQLQLDFATNVIRELDTSPNMTNIGVLTYSTYPHIVFQLSQYQGDMAGMHERIHGIKQIQDQTNTHLALQMVRQQMFTRDQIRPWVPQVSRL